MLTHFPLFSRRFESNAFTQFKSLERCEVDGRACSWLDDGPPLVHLNALLSMKNACDRTGTTITSHHIVLLLLIPSCITASFTIPIPLV